MNCVGWFVLELPISEIRQIPDLDTHPSHLIALPFALSVDRDSLRLCLLGWIDVFVIF